MTLSELLKDLISYDQCPRLDRWFSAHARRLGWSLVQQKTVWDKIRILLVRVSHLGPVEALAPNAGWDGFRSSLKGKEMVWIDLLSQPETKLPSDIGVPRWLRESWRSRASLEAWSSSFLQTLPKDSESPCPWHIRFSGTTEGLAARSDLDRRGLIRDLGWGAAQYLGEGELLSNYLRSGAVQTQDLASQRSLDCLDLKPGLRVWDVCAGNGGKTLLAAERLANKGALFASDVVPLKLAQLKKRIKDSGWQNIRTIAWNGQELPEFPREISLRGGFDRVFVDAPCSASGTWRRDPEARWRLTSDALLELGVHQRRLLRLGWDALRPGGTLLYITCSWLVEENEQVAADFSTEAGLAPTHQKLLGPPDLNSNWMFTAVWEKPR